MPPIEFETGAGSMDVTCTLDKGHLQMESDLKLREAIWLLSDIVDLLARTRTDYHDFEDHLRRIRDLVNKDELVH